jgi:hypothetical protein
MAYHRDQQCNFSLINIDIIIRHSILKKFFSDEYIRLGGIFKVILLKNSFIKLEKCQYIFYELELELEPAESPL